jgi:hypothetical protein
MPSPYASPDDEQVEIILKTLEGAVSVAAHRDPCVIISPLGEGFDVSSNVTDGRRYRDLGDKSTMSSSA